LAAIGLMQATAGGVNLRRVHILRQKEIAHPLLGDLAGATECVARHADDVVIVEDGDRCLCGHFGFRNCFRARHYTELPRQWNFSADNFHIPPHCRR
jgi:hypothetical protein